MRFKAQLTLLFAAALSISLIGSAQEMQPDGGPPGGHTLRGTVTAAAPPFFTVKSEQGEIWQVKLGPNARLVKGGMRPHARGAENDGEPPTPITVADVHVGDTLAAGGDVDPTTKKLNAAFAFLIDAATVKKLEADWGVTYIAGRVAAINADDAKITVQRPDGKSTTIQADENTSFRKGRESITLADIKTGDTVTGRGAQKNGTFTPTTLVVIDPNARRGPRNRGSNAPASNPQE